jgi:LPXTG-site transpeptidase (sortase) family protein
MHNFRYVLGALGILLVITGFTYLGYKKTVLSFTGTLHYQNAGNIGRTLDRPSDISIPSASIRVKITESTISHGTWETSASSASHLSLSATPGQNGNIVIYGHNTANIFGRLAKAKTGDMIFVRVGNPGKTYAYIIRNIRLVNPSDIDVIQPTAMETLTVYTCTGWFDSKRLVITAYPALSFNPSAYP